jgi:S-adenosylmethionine:tRNA ribosyltransferase-isomerase
LKTSDFDYHLPPGRIAQTPVEPRDASRLLVLPRQGGEAQHAVFRDLGGHLLPGDLLVLNETRVIPARLYARKVPTGGQVELLLLRRVDEHSWEALVGGKRVKQGLRLEVEDGPKAEVMEVLEGSRRILHFAQPLEPYLLQAGHVPLPPYIHAPLMDPERYQTVYSRTPGSAAAPTAGLHFTAPLIERLQEQGIGFARLTLHVGLDTFAPVTDADPSQHRMHTEWCQLTPETAAQINDTRRQGGRVIAVGTTSVRTLESAARLAVPGETVAAWEGSSDLYILPGFTFRAVDAMLTNFHLPRSTLIMLVSAFTGRERLLDAYELAIKLGYRFYSFGDAMLIL